MEKALNVFNWIEYCIKSYGRIMLDDNDMLALKEAIAELEEEMKPKTCDGCKWEVIGKYCILPVGCCIRKSEDYFEPKDNS